MDTIYKALTDKTRRKILEILKSHDMTVGEIAQHFDMTGATLSHHLDTLKKARLVISERKGQFIVYSLNTSVLEETMKMILNLFDTKERTS